MPASEISTNKLSIYLIKEEYTLEKQILKNPSNKINIEGVGSFFFENSRSHQPSWVNSFFGDTLNGISFLTSSAKGGLLVKINHNDKGVFFFISFGTGRFMLKDGVIEERFGLKTTLNTVKPNSLRSIEKSSLTAGTKISKEQMSKATKATDFGIDIEQDLIKEVAGLSKLISFGNTLSGADALSVSTKVDISNISQFLGSCYNQYKSNEYQADFDWIDNIQGLKNGVIISSLNTLLIEKLNNRELDKIWMAVPDLIEWIDIKGFKVPNKKELIADIYIIDFLDNLKDEIKEISQLKTKYIQLISASTDECRQEWTAYKCINAEIEKDDRQYVLNNGKWYEVNNNFVTVVNNYYSSIQLSNINLPDFNHLDEEKYNEAAALSNPNYLLMDRKNIIYGGGRSSIEFCDLFTKDNKLIHVKPYSGSSVLSHLFQQGFVSAELLLNDSDFREKLNEKLDDGWKLTNTNIRITPENYEIIYAIISNDPDERPNIPFFSKVALKNITRRLKSFGYNVSLKRIKSIK